MEVTPQHSFPSISSRPSAHTAQSRSIHGMLYDNEEIALLPRLAHSSSPFQAAASPTVPPSAAYAPSDFVESLQDKYTTQSSDTAYLGVSYAPAERQRKSGPASLAKSANMVALLTRKSAVWVCLGVGIMLAGIAIAQAAILPRIHTCPPDATCPNSFDLNSSNVLQLLQTGMTYWIRAGTLLAGIGLVRLSAYQSWFILMRHGNTIENLDYNIGAIKGDLLDACRLVLRRGTRWLSILVLGPFVIDVALSLVVGFSISREFGERSIMFAYSDISRLPDSSLAGLNSDGQVWAINKVESWALNNDTSHGSALRGTLVVPDSRSNYSIHSEPGGPRISGNIACAGVDTYTIVNNSSSPQYNIQIGDLVYTALPNMKLAVTMTSVDTARTDYLWVSNTTGVLPNGTLTSDGKMTIALCNHTVYMLNVSQTEGIQYIDPNVPVTSGCGSNDVDVCVADSVNNAVLSWWGGVGTNFWRVSCRGGVVGPLSLGDVNCSLTAELWSETVTSMLDGIMQTAPRSGLATQQLMASVVNISSTRWWLQGIIPLCTAILYCATLSYTCKISRGSGTLKELTLSEVVSAAQTDHVRGLAHSGRLKGAVTRYGADTGFVTD